MKIYNLKKWHFVKSLIDQLNLEGTFIWRGHSNSDFKLTSSLRRHFVNQKIKTLEWSDKENRALNYFKESIAYTKIQTSTGLTWIDIMQIMQHYGCPTRLLDWTYSPYIATYFTRYSIAPKAIYALNLNVYKNYLDKLYPELSSFGGLITNLENKGLMKLIRSSKKLPPLPIKPAPIFERPLMQKSIFLLDLSLDKSLTSTIDAIDKNLLIKIEFPATVIREAIKDLDMMNIDGYHLFGGAEGVAQKAKELIFS